MNIVINLKVLYHYTYTLLKTIFMFFNYLIMSLCFLFLQLLNREFDKQLLLRRRTGRHRQSNGRLYYLFMILKTNFGLSLFILL